MAHGIQGPYDPATYVAANPATWPQPVTDPLYQPGMWWSVSVAGSFDGTPVIVGDRIYVVGSITGRRYGDETYGAAIYGGPTSGDWSPFAVSFVVWPISPPVWDRPAVPYTGCPYGDRFPGWSIVVEAYFNDDENARRYGFGTYGSGVYGSPGADVYANWHDITHPAFSVVLDRGGHDAGHVVPVDGLVIDVNDPDAEWFPLDVPAAWSTPSVGTRVRVGLLDAGQEYTPLAVGRIERITDVHDTPPRQVTVDAYGTSFDSVVALISWQRPAETTVARLDALRSAMGWTWAPPIYPATPGPSQLAAPLVGSTDARAQTDRTAISAGWSADTTAKGEPRFRPWPIVPTGTPLKVTDCGDVVPGVPRVDGYMSPMLGAATVPDPAPLTNAGTLVFRVRLDAYPPTGYATLAAQRANGSTDFSYQCAVDSAGRIALRLSANGTTILSPVVGAPLALGDHLMAITHDGAAGRVRQWRSLNGGSTWVEIATVATTVAVPFNSSQPVSVGKRAASGAPVDIFDGRIYSAEYRTGLTPTGGSVVWRFDANEYPGGGVATFYDPRGLLWSVTAAGLTPMIPAIPPSSPAFDTPQRDGYLTPTVGYVTTADAPGDNYATRFRLIYHIRPSTGWATGAADNTLGSQWGSAPYSWYFGHRSGGLTFGGSVDGSGTQSVYAVLATDAQTNVAAPDNVDSWIGVDIDPVAGTLTAIRSTDGVNWVAFGTTFTRAPFVLFDSPSAHRVGSRGSNPFPGRIYSAAFQRLNAAGAVTATMYRFDANEYPGTGTSYFDPRGRGWTMTVAGSITPKVPAVLGDRLAVSISYVSDMADLLTRASASNVDDAVATADNVSAVGQYGIRDRTLGFPLDDLTAAVPDMSATVRRAVDRFATSVTRATAIEADTHVDRRWFEALRVLDTGAAITITRRGIDGHEYALAGIVTGIQHRMSPDRWRATLFVSTITPTS